jgi:CENP-B N-terminal DNA-binding domain
MRFAAQRRFTPEQEAEIVRLYATGQHSQHALARQFGCSQGTIARILKDKPDMNVAALQRRIAKLETALRFYADAENWRRNGQLDPDSGNFTGGPARAALAGGKDE